MKNKLFILCLLVNVILNAILIFIGEIVAFGYFNATMGWISALVIYLIMKNP